MLPAVCLAIRLVCMSAARDDSKKHVAFGLVMRTTAGCLTEAERERSAAVDA